MCENTAGQMAFLSFGTWDSFEEVRGREDHVVPEVIDPGNDDSPSFFLQVSAIFSPELTSQSC